MLSSDLALAIIPQNRETTDMRSSIWIRQILGCALGLAACSDNETGNEAKGGPQDEGGGSGAVMQATYHGQVRGILEQHCNSCHRDGGSAPFNLDEANTVVERSAAILNAMENRRMPPWQPDPDCQPHRGERIVDDAEIALVREWVEAGTPMGDEAEYQGPILPLSSRGPDEDPALRLKAESPYRPSGELTDEYRCLVLPHTFTEDTYLTALDIVPDQVAMVHHALIYLVTADDITEMQTLDAEDPGEGYSCFGSPEVSITTVGSWVPGSEPQVFPEGAAYVLPAGSQLVMQMHYFVLDIDGPPPEDHSELLLWTMAPETSPSHRVRITPIAQDDFLLPAGESNVEVSFDIASPTELKVIGDMPHMHSLGTSFRVDVEREDGSLQCLSHIPRWDFEWQQYYAYRDDAFVDLGAGDRLQMRCTYDNSAANQPVFDGQQQEPRDVTWGDGSLDEMCLFYLTTMEPFAGDPQSCAPYDDCMERCREHEDLVTCLGSCNLVFSQPNCLGR